MLIGQMFHPYQALLQIIHLSRELGDQFVIKAPHVALSLRRTQVYYSLYTIHFINSKHIWQMLWFLRHFKQFCRVIIQFMHHHKKPVEISHPHEDAVERSSTDSGIVQSRRETVEVLQFNIQRIYLIRTDKIHLALGACIRPYTMHRRLQWSARHIGQFNWPPYSTGFHYRWC